MFRIGEFSKIAQVSGRLLRYYDTLGLFTPIWTDPETGYRYYSAKQLPELNRILALKELGLTLEQITGLLAGPISADEIRGMLLMKKAQLEQTMREELARIRFIEARLDQIEREGQLQDYEVVLKSFSAQAWLAAREPSTTLAACRTAARDIGRSVPAQIDSKALGHFVLVIHSELWEADNLDVEIGFILNRHQAETLTLPGGRVMRVQELPAVEMMATTMYAGIPERGQRCYAALGLWAEANGYHFAGPSREMFIRLPKAGAEREIVAEIQIPVAKNSDSSHSCPVSS